MAGVADLVCDYFCADLSFVPTENLAHAEPVHLIAQVVFHGIFVVIVATLTYVEAIKRLGAFKAGKHCDVWRL